MVEVVAAVVVVLLVAMVMARHRLMLAVLHRLSFVCVLCLMLTRLMHLQQRMELVYQLAGN